MHCCATVVVNTRNELIIVPYWDCNEPSNVNTLSHTFYYRLPLWRFALYCTHRSRRGTVINTLIAFTLCATTRVGPWLLEKDWTVPLRTIVSLLGLLLNTLMAFTLTKNVEIPFWRSLYAPTRVESMAAGARLNCSVKNYCFPVGFINEHPYGVYTRQRMLKCPFGVHGMHHTSGVHGCSSATETKKPRFLIAS
jgi:hypothetical protein